MSTRSWARSSANGPLLRAARFRFLALAAACLGVVACGSAASIGAARPRGARCAWRVCITASESPGGIAYRIENAEPVPATVVLEFKALRNLESLEGSRVERIVAPHSSALVRLDRVGGRRGSTNLSIAIDLGASATAAEDYLYAVPFGDTVPRRLIQSFDGEETHMGSMRYALDFAMPPYTPILAARSGVVLYLQDGFTKGGTDPALLEKANLVVVAHADGSMASYGHLSPGIEVAVGDTVVTGQLLGWSGSTGFAGQPHLHFHVGLRMLGEPGRTIPIRLGDADGVPLDLVEGMTVPPARTSY